MLPVRAKKNLPAAKKVKAKPAAKMPKAAPKAKKDTAVPKNAAKTTSHAAAKATVALRPKMRRKKANNLYKKLLSSISAAIS